MYHDEVIDAGLCLLRPWDKGDAASLAFHADDPQVARRLRDRFPSPYALADAEQFIAHARAAREEWCLAIVFDGAPVGSISARLGEDVHRHTAELGYWVARTYWRRGVATAAVSAFVPRAMQRLRLYRLFARVYSDNPASMRLLEKCGFKREATLRCEVFKGGQVLDSVMYAKTRAALDPAG